MMRRVVVARNIAFAAMLIVSFAASWVYEKSPAVEAANLNKTVQIYMYGESAKFVTANESYLFHTFWALFVAYILLWLVSIFSGDRDVLFGD